MDTGFPCFGWPLEADGFAVVRSGTSPEVEWAFAIVVVGEEPLGSRSPGTRDLSMSLKVGSSGGTKLVVEERTQVEP